MPGCCRLSVISLLKAKTVILSELEQEKYSPEPELEFTQLRYMAAYNGCGLGIPEIATPESLNNIDASTIYNYHRHLYTPENIVIAGINVNHELLLKYVENFFVFPESTEKNISETATNYVGGCAIKYCDKPRIQPGHAEFPELAHIGVGFKCFPDAHPSHYASCVMHGILGSGRSFSSGGPGKGLFSRLNQNILCRHHWANSCLSDIISYSDTGLYYIYGACEPEFVEFIRL
ncbi:hypothetical protein HZS_2978 [Henneguya salminicola]|nr:hypothetical protein HZS_2978 [Henneguya salminicola]